MAGCCLVLGTITSLLSSLLLSGARSLQTTFLACLPAEANVSGCGMIVSASQKRVRNSHNKKARATSMHIHESNKLLNGNSRTCCRLGSAERCEGCEAARACERLTRKTVVHTHQGHLLSRQSSQQLSQPSLHSCVH